MATYTLFTIFTWTAIRTDMPKSTQQVILNRTVHSKMDFLQLFLYVTNAQTHYILLIYGGVGYKNGWLIARAAGTISFFRDFYVNLKCREKGIFNILHNIGFM